MGIAALNSSYGLNPFHEVLRHSVNMRLGGRVFVFARPIEAVGEMLAHAGTEAVLECVPGEFQCFAYGVERVQAVGQHLPDRLYWAREDEDPPTEPHVH